MNLHSRKMIAPIVIVGLLVAYYLGIGIILLFFDLPIIIRVGVSVVSLSITIVLLYVLRERIKEIRKGEEDDLSQY
jgi:heme A synthase